MGPKYYRRGVKMQKLMLIIEPTYGCNMRCKHCYHAVRGFGKQKLPVEGAVRFFELATRKRKNIELLFHGGEPTIVGADYYRTFFGAIRPIVIERSLNLTTIIQTNGRLLVSPLLDILIDNQVKIGVSFDGFHNDVLRTNTKEVLSNILQAKRKGAYIVALCVETAETIHDLVQNYEWFKEHNIDYKIMPFFRAGQESSNEEYVITAKDYVKAMIELYTYWLIDQDVSIHVQTLESFLRLFSDSNQRIPIGGTCVGNCLTLMPDKTIWPCNRPLPRKYCMGTLDMTSECDDWFNSSGYHAIFSLQCEREQYCEACSFYTQCHTGCIAYAIEENYPILREGETCLRTKLLLEQLRLINSEVYATNKYRGCALNSYAETIVKSN